MINQITTIEKELTQAGLSINRRGLITIKLPLNMDDWTKQRLRENLLYIAKGCLEDKDYDFSRSRLKAYYRPGAQYLFLNACSGPKNHRTVAIYEMLAFSKPQKVILQQ